jgi:multidrug transporter EmrE-like cation transporter
VAIVGGPLAFALGGVLSPSIHETGKVTIDANIAANAAGNAVHLAAFFVASFLLPIGAAGLAYLAYTRAPWTATIGGLLGVAGWLPFSALTALDDLGYAMAQPPTSATNAELLDRFSTDAAMNSYLIIYIVCHLVAYVLLGIALHRARVVPAWASWTLIASTPVTIGAFVLPGRPLFLGNIALIMLLLGSFSAARKMLTTDGLSGRHA